MHNQLANPRCRIMDLVCKQYFADKQMIDPNYHYTPIVMGGENPQCDANSEV